MLPPLYYLVLFHLNLTRAEAAVVLFVVYHTELAGSHTMNLLVGMDDVGLRRRAPPSR